MITNKRFFLSLVMTLLMGLPAVSAADKHGSEKRDRDRSGPDEAMIILTSDSLQTRAMSMVLGTAMQEQGTDVMSCCVIPPASLPSATIKARRWSRAGRHLKGC